MLRGRVEIAQLLQRSGTALIQEEDARIQRDHPPPKKRTRKKKKKEQKEVDTDKPARPFWRRKKTRYDEPALGSDGTAAGNRVLV